MRQTAYEFVRKGFGSGWAEAVKLEAEGGGGGRVLRETILKMMDGRGRISEELLAAIPFALAVRVLKAIDTATWRDFATHPDVTEFINVEASLGQAIYKPDLALDWQAASILNLWHFAMHERTGQRVYELAPALATKLHHTQLRGLSTADLRLPYQNIYIVMPETMELKLSNQLTGEHDLGGVYVTETTHDGARMWKLLFWGPPNKNSRTTYDDALFHFSVPLPDDISLDEALDRCERRGLSAQTEHSERYYREFWRPLFKLVLNTVIYLTWPDADSRAVENSRYTALHEQMKKHPKGSRKYERARQELREVPQQRRILLGGSVRDLSPATEATSGSPLMVRTLVTGHWQRFAVGPGRADRRWGWREPFWRGPADAPESNPRRVLDVKETEHG